jgi:hypothetical protein
MTAQNASHVNKASFYFRVNAYNAPLLSLAAANALLMASNANNATTPTLSSTKQQTFVTA